uniref:Glycosyltransferase n=1 Tax=Desulfatirhabdium butyrativorans TaxID=340467 RepID=A0A7C4RQE7_9BACT
MSLFRYFDSEMWRRCFDTGRAWLMQRPALHRLWGKTVEAVRCRVRARKSPSNGMSNSRVNFDNGLMPPPGMKMWERHAVPLQLPTADCRLPTILTINARDRVVAEESCTERLPDWLIRQWRAMHDIDPSIFPDREVVDSIPFCTVHPSAASHVFVQMLDATGETPDHVFLVPWLNTGGAERVALNYVHAVRYVCPERRIVVMATHPAESPWASKLPEGVPFLEFGKWTAHLNDVEREYLLVRWLMQTAPTTVHNINSRLGLQVFKRYGPVLRNRMRLYSSHFCMDFTPEGKRIGYAVEFLPWIIDHLTAVTVDNRTFRDQLMTWYAFDPEKVILVYQPVSLPNTRFPVEADDGPSARGGKKAFSAPSDGRIQSPNRITLRTMTEKKPRLDVLWAGRIDDQKRPDILLKMIEAAADLPFFFHVYGAAVLNRDRYTHRLRQFDNAWYYGPFDGFESLPTSCFDVFLYTSQWDGLPTILLDALAAGLPVVASDVGGIGEVIQHEETGLLVRPFDDVRLYLEQLRRIHAYPEQAAWMARQSMMRIRSDHTWRRFYEAVRALPGYCGP